MRELAADYQGRAVIAQLDADSNNSTIQKYKVEGLPTALFFSNGELVGTIVGKNPKSAYVEKLDALLSQSSTAADGE